MTGNGNASIRRYAGLTAALCLVAGTAAGQAAGMPEAVCRASVVRQGRTAPCQAMPGDPAVLPALPAVRFPGIAQASGYAYPRDPLETPLQEVLLPRLFDDGTRLDGLYARVSSARLNPDGTPLPGRDGTADFRYLPNEAPVQDCIANLADCAPFDAVNVYFHVDRFAQEYWVDRMGMDIPFQAEVVTHISGDGGFADGSRHLIKLAVGNLFTKNAAKEDDFIYHEYTHLVTYALGFAVDISTPVEARALNEGYADYFAASFTDDPHIGEWVVTCPDRQHCVGPPNDTDFRTLSTDPGVWNWRFGQPVDTLKYGVCTRFHEGDGKCKISYNNFADQYVWGMIWAGALWDLRARLGADVVDRLALEGLRLRHEPDLTFATALAGLLEADGQYFAGEHEATIRVVFEDRGIRPAETTVAVEATPERPGLTLHPAYPNPFRERTEIRFVLPTAGPASVVVYDALGRIVAHLADGWHTAGRYTAVWDATGMPAGLYLVQVRAGATLQTQTLLRVR